MEISSGSLASSARKKVIEELVRGCESASQLKLVLDHQLTGAADRESVTTEHLITEVLKSFKEALSILSDAESSKISSTSQPYQNHCGLGSQTRNMQQHTWTKTQACRPTKDGHGGRKSGQKEIHNAKHLRNMPETLTRVTSVPIEDGYAWRKYGQKEILNAKHLRCYYRCSYRFDQGCQATKQVQRTEDEPPTFWTKYIGHHTCQDILKATLEMDSNAEKGVLLSFELDTQTKQGPPPSFSSSLPSSNEDHSKKSTTPSIVEERHKPKARARLLIDLNNRYTHHELDGIDSVC